MLALKNYPQLARKTLIGVAKKVEAEYEAIGPQILPERKTSATFRYRVYGKKTSYAEPVPEGSEAPLETETYEIREDTTEELRKGDYVSVRSIRHGEFDVVADTVASLTRAILVGQDILTFQAIENVVPSEHKKSLTKSWDEDGADPKSDLLEAIKKIMRNGGVRPDTLILNATNYANLMEHANVLVYEVSGRPEILREGRIDRLLGLDIFVVKGAKDGKELLEDKAIVMYRGTGGLNGAGFTAVSDPLEVVRELVPNRNSLYVEVWKAVKPVIQFPYRTYLMTNVG